MIFKAGFLRKAGADIPAYISDDAEISAHTLSPYHARKKKRDLSKAITLRPAEIYELYGIHSTTVSQYARHPDPAVRLPSLKIGGKSGRKGMRLIDHAAFRAWLEQWRQ
jgi:hypothetical protein